VRTLLAAALFTAGLAHAQGEIILDNGSAAFTTTGTWPTSTSVPGFIGPNYQSHEPNGAPPSAIVVDNAHPGFSVTGTWPTSTAVSGFLGGHYQVHAANGEPPSAIVADNSSGSAIGTWPTSTAVSGFVGTNYQIRPAGTGASMFIWTLAVPSAGTYQAYARWTQHPNRATNAKYTVNHASGAQVVMVNMEQGGGSWSLLGTFDFNSGPTTISLSDDANDYVIADAVMLVPTGASPNTATWTLSVPTAGSYQVYARWTQHPNRATDAKYTVTHAFGSTEVTVNQEAGGGNWNSLGTFDFNAGTASVSLTDQANGYVIADSVMLVPPGAAPNTATWTPNVAQAGSYEIYARWSQHTNRATDATYTVIHASGSTAIPVNQQQNGGAWNLLGTYTLQPGAAHKISLTDQANGYLVADAIQLVPVNLIVEKKLYFIHVDHLNTAREIYNASQQLVWRRPHHEPFSVSPPDENPSGLGVFEFPLAESNYYDDRETGMRYAMNRDCYDPETGRFCESDPIGLQGGINTYLYVDGSPLLYIDPLGEAGENPGGTPGLGSQIPRGPLPKTPISPSINTQLIGIAQRCVGFLVATGPGQFVSGAGLMLYSPSIACQTVRGCVNGRPAPPPPLPAMFVTGSQPTGARGMGYNLKPSKPKAPPVPPASVLGDPGDL
jgi:RHS repeat-associated protein